MPVTTSTIWKTIEETYKNSGTFLRKEKIQERLWYIETPTFGRIFINEEKKKLEFSWTKGISVVELH